MLAGLDEVDWAALEDARGSARQLPDLLRQLAACRDPALARQLAETATDGMVHQACVYPATAAAIPFLVELASDRSVPAREWLLATVASAAMCEGSELERPFGVRRAVAAQVASLIPLLSDPLVEVRLMAATALGHCDPPQAEAGAILDERRRVEAVASVRCALIASAAACDPTAARAWVAQAYADESRAVQAAAVYATAINALPWTAATTRALRECLRDGDPLPLGEDWVWDLRWWLGAALQRLDEDGVRVVLDDLLEAPQPQVRSVVLEAVEQLAEQSREAVGLFESRLPGYRTSL